MVCASTRRFSLILLFALLTVPTARAQFGGGGGGFGGGGGGAPPPETRPKFRDVVHSRGGISLRREKGDAVVQSVRVVGNRVVGMERIYQELETRKDRFYDYETVLGDVRRLNDLGSFEKVTFKIDPKPDGVHVTFYVQERPTISRVVFHGQRGLGKRELRGRAGIGPGDPLNEFSIESARRRLIDYYREEGFNQVAITTSVGLGNDPGVVVLRINEGPKERIYDIKIVGNTIVSEARLKKVIQSRGPFGGFIRYVGNTANLSTIDQDVNVLASYYHNLGFLTATVGRRIQYDTSGKWITVTYVIDEGQRFRVNDVQIVGNQFVTAESIRARLELKPGDMFDGT
ncbi:MAG: hypothetical protein MI861_13110, partial [Pirellulales bacterium]|nr:hypothetical protein [Pirellulales bacterium]